MTHTQKLTIIALEPRMMFDAAGVATVTEVLHDTIDTGTLDAPMVVSEAATSAASVLERHEVAFVDAGVQDYQSLIYGIGANVDVYVVESSADGIAYMASVLENLKGIDAVHVLGHGSEASITLGSTVLTQENLASYTQTLSTIGNALNDTGDILLYGCYVGSGEGEAFIQSFADITKADIAASNDLTGSAALGGDWDLEVVSGNIESESIAIESFNNKLATTNVLVFSKLDMNGDDSNPAEATENANLASIVQYFINGTSSGYTSYNENGAYSNAYTAYDFSNFKVDSSLTSYADTGLQTKLDNASFLFMPDMESGFNVDTIDLPTSARTILKDWVNAGGVLMMTGTYGSKDTDFLNAVFNWDLTTTTGSNWSLNTTNATGTPFVNGPLSLSAPSATDSIGKGTVAGFTAMYGTDDNATVATISYGSGKVIFLGFDFYSAGISGTGYVAQSGNTNFVYDVSTGSTAGDSWVQQIVPRALQYSAILSGAGDVNEDEAYTFKSDSFKAGGTTLSQIKITSLPTNGTLQLSGVTILNNAVIASSDYTYLTYTPSSNYNGDDIFIWQGWNGSVYSADVNYNITVTAVNDIPYISGIETATVNEDTSITLSGISVSDADGTSLTVTIGANHGNLSLGSSSGLSVTGGATHALTLTGTVANLNTALATLIRYQGDADWFGSDPLSITVNDNQGSGSQPYRISQTGKFFNTENGHYYEFVSTSGITWDQAKIAAEAKTLYGLNGYLVTITSATENALMVSMAGGNGWIGASDATSEGIWKWVTGPEAGTQFWTGDTSAGTSVTSNSGSVYNGQYANWASGEPNNSGDEDVAHFYYSDTNAGEWNDFTSTNTSSITGYIVEYGGLSGTLTAANLTITVASVNDLPINQATIAAQFLLEDFLNYTIDLRTYFSDIETADASLTYSYSGNTNIGISISGGVATISSSTDNWFGSETIRFTATDSSGASIYQDVIFTVTSVNDVPTNTVPTTRTNNEDAPIVFSSANSNLISIADVDATSVTTTLSIGSGKGTLTATSGGGTTITNNGTTTVQITGTVEQVNAALAGLTYTPTADVNGSAYTTLTVATSDGIVTDTDTVTINITAVNDAPIGADKTITINEDTPTVLAASDFGFSDIDGNTLSSVKITSLATNGSLQYSSDGSSWSTVTTNQVISKAMLDGNRLKFIPDANEYGMGYATFQFKVNDGTVDASAENTITCNVIPINDTPTNTVPSARTTNEDTAIIFSSANSNLISIADVDATSVTTTLSIGSVKGTLTATSGGATISNNGTTTVQITGTVAQVNAALAGLTYTPTANANGNTYTTLTVVTNDGTTTDTDTITINITAVNDTPTFSPLTSISYTDTSVLDTFIATTGTASASDIDSTLVYSILGTGVVDNSITASLIGTYGTLTLTKSTGAYTYTPNAGAINALSATVTETFTLQASDGSLSTTQELTITLNGVNDTPVFGEIAQNDTGTTLIADGATLPSSAIEVLNNGLLKFGNGSIDSVNATTGMLEQPWYYKDGEWYKLTYSSYMLNFAIAAEGDGTNTWNLNGTVNMYPSFTSTMVDNSGFVANGGYGTIVYTGYITVGNTDLKVAQVYTLSQTGSFVKVTTQITNMEATATATNLRIWVGTQDDWVGNTDGPTKVKGNIVNGEFVAISNTTDPASAIKIYSGDSAVLFYSTSDNVNTSISYCCSFSNATNQSPCSSSTTLTGDGSYAMFLRLDDLAPGASQSLDWYYAAGATNEIASIVSSVAQAAAVGLSESNSGELTSSGTYPVSDIDTSDSVTASLVSVGALQQTSSGTTLTSSAFQPSNIDLMAMLSINPTTVIDTTHTSGTLNWAFKSGTQTFDYLKAGEKLVLTYTLRATDSSTATVDQTVTITINGTNDAPIHTMPASQSINEDGTLTLSTATSNAISLGITDDETITTTLSVSGVMGTLHVNSGSGATITNDGSSSVQIVGSRAQINAALDGLVYTPTANANGTASLQIVSSDGNSSDTDTITINVTAVDDLPVATSMAATVGPTSKQLFSYFAPTFSDIEGEYPTAITITSLPTVGTFEVYDGSGDRGDDTNWTTITSVPFVVAMNEMGNYRFNGGEATNNGTTAVVTWKVRTTGNTTDAGWSNEASGAITILDYNTNTTPTVSITYPEGTTTTGSSQSTTQEFPNATTPISSITTTTSGKVITINEDAQTATITLTYSDTITPSQFMQGLMQSSDTDLIDFSNASCYTMSQTVNESGQGVVTLVLKPKANMYGEAIITLGANDGQKTTAESFTLKVLPINETPVAQDFLRTIAEDQPFYFNAINPAEIYTDSFDTNANANHQVNYNAQMAIIMAAQQEGATTEQQNAAGVAIQALVDVNYFPKAFVIETLPSHGALYLSEAAITSAGTSVPIEQLSILTYRPNANYYGNDSFQWYGIDQAPNGNNGISSLSKVASFTMTPVNDLPFIQGDGYLGNVTETNTAITIAGELNVVDVDPNDIVVLNVESVSVDFASTFSGTNPLTSSQMQAMFSIIDTTVDANPDAGSTFGWRFTSGNSGHEAFDFLPLGETLVLKYTIRATDDSGINSSFDEQVITITITGSNDVPVALLDQAEALESGGLFNAIKGNDAVGNVLTNDTDIDSSDTHFVESIVEVGMYGTLTLQSNGGFRYIVDERNIAVEALRKDQSLQESFTYTLKDNHDASSQGKITITINGAEDIPAPTPEVKTGESSLGGGTSFDPIGSHSLGGLLPSGQSDFGTQKTITPMAQNIMTLNESTASSALSTNAFVIRSVDQVPPYVTRDVISGTSTGEGQSLRLNTPVETQRFPAGEKVTFTLPRGTFIEIDPKATVMLDVTLPNGAILPSWISFNPYSGEFTFDLSQTSQRIVELRIVARDSNGVEVETILQIDIIQSKGEKTSDTPATQSDASDIDKITPIGKQGLHEQFVHAKAEEKSFEALVAWLEELVEDISLNTKESA